MVRMKQVKISVKKDVDSYTIRGTNKVVHVGDCVLMRASDSDKQPYVARVEKMEADGRGSVRVQVRWYYRPEESKGGRRQFHGAKELFLSDHFDLQSAHTIEGKCVVHSFKNYTKLDNVGPEDFFSRFEYKAATGIANVRCHTTRMTSWCSAKLARTGSIHLAWL
uniref:BAH domain-containing protein n=1 Tax=Zea mays TaxID=4577 RepID=A0A804LWN8_MAIZE